MADTATVADQLATIDEARKRLGGISRPTIYGYINRGELATVPLGRRRFIAYSELTRFIHEREQRNH